MPARLKLVGPTSRHGVFLYDEDVVTVEIAYSDHGLSGFVRELVHRHCEAVRQKQLAQMEKHAKSTLKPAGASAS